MATIIWANAPQFLVWSRLRSLRQSLNLTQVQVSAGAGVPIMTLSFLERGYIEPSQTIKRKLCDFFQVGEQDLFPVMMLGNEPYKPKRLARTPQKVKAKLEPDQGEQK
jgi:transcriptional regulator with XRE-family HTH domain